MELVKWSSHFGVLYDIGIVIIATVSCLVLYCKKKERLWRKPILRGLSDYFPYKVSVNHLPANRYSVIHCLCKKSNALAGNALWNIWKSTKSKQFRRWCLWFLNYSYWKSLSKGDLGIRSIINNMSRRLSFIDNLCAWKTHVWPCRDWHPTYRSLWLALGQDKYSFKHSRFLSPSVNAIYRRSKQPWAWSRSWWGVRRQEGWLVVTSLNWDSLPHAVQ